MAEKRGGERAKKTHTLHTAMKNGRTNKSGCAVRSRSIHPRGYSSLVSRSSRSFAYANARARALHIYTPRGIYLYARVSRYTSPRACKPKERACTYVADLCRHVSRALEREKRAGDIVRETIFGPVGTACTGHVSMVILCARARRRG